MCNNVDFKDVTPEVLGAWPELSPLYVEAFLAHEEKSISEYAQNTTTWD